MRITSVLAGMVMAVMVLGCGPAAATPTGSDGGGGGGPTSGPTDPADSPTDAPTRGPDATSDDGLGSLPDPCTLITLDEAGAAVLAQMADGFHDLVSTPALGSGRQCWFENADGSDGDALVRTFADPGELWEVYKLERSQFGVLTELTGVGDKGFTVGNGECVVVKGEILMELMLRPADGFATDPEPRMIVLCQQAAARL